MVQKETSFLLNFPPTVVACLHVSAFCTKNNEKEYFYLCFVCAPLNLGPKYTTDFSLFSIYSSCFMPLQFFNPILTFFLHVYTKNRLVNF